MEMNDTGLPYKVENLEKRTNNLEKTQQTTSEILSEIKTGVGVIKETLISTREQEELKNQLLMKDIEGMKERVNKLESNQKWLITSIIGEVLGIIFGVIMIFIEKGM